MKHFVDSKRNVFEEYPDAKDWTFIIYQWATNWMTTDAEMFRAVNDYVMNLRNENSNNLAMVLNHCLEFQSKDELERTYDFEKLQRVVGHYKQEGRLTDELIALADEVSAKFSQPAMTAVAPPAFRDLPLISEEASSIEGSSKES